MTPPLRVTVPLPEPTPAAPEPAPWFELGSVVPVTLSSDMPQRVTLRLRVRCHGSGSPESRVVAERTVDLPGQAIADVAIPSGEPPSYCGEHVKIDWTLEALVDGTPIAEIAIWIKPRRAGR